MNRYQMLAELRTVLNEASVPVGSGWTDYTLLGYLSEGQDKFCEDTGFFSDITTFTLTLEEGVSAYAIPDRVIQIMSIWDGSRKLGKVLTGETRTENGDDNYYPNTVEVGTPAAWQTDKETGVVVLTPTPTSEEAGGIYTLQVWRYSLKDLADDTSEVANEPEIPSRFHRACIEWAAYKALNHHDMDTQDKVKAQDHFSAFKMYVYDGRTALRRIQNEEVRISCDRAYVV